MEASPCLYSALPRRESISAYSCYVQALSVMNAHCLFHFVFVFKYSSQWNKFIILCMCLLFISTPPFSLVTYVDEDENEILELSSNKTFLVMLKIPEACVTEEELPNLLTKRVMNDTLCIVY